ncbi:MAG TPA: hypothetical protein VG672_03265 [Bryobacteraceae bacterium]|nr:hypothetical protein [Bryobacteraceae bacterium]
MSKNSVTEKYIQELKTQNRPADKSKTPPPPMPDDLENQILSSDPLERLRQLDQQEADRIERTEG